MAKVDKFFTAEEESAAIADIKNQFDAFTRSELHPSKLLANLCDICREHTEATWEALSLVDQYHRRGLLGTEVFINAKTALNAIAFGAPRALDTSRATQSAQNGGVRVEPSWAATTPQASAEAKYNVDPSSNNSPNNSSNSWPNNTAAPQISAEAANTPVAAVVKCADDPVVADVRLSPSNTIKQSLRATNVLLDRYVLIEPIHTTAIATSFKAYDRKRSELSEGERFVSIKGLNAASASAPEAQAFLEHEFKQSKDLFHPNILATYDYHVDSEASFLVQGLLEGQLLSRLIERLVPRCMLQAQALAIVREVGLALAYAHEKNVVHGALSTDMVLVGSSGSIKVFGFGSGGVTPSGISARDDKDRSDDIFALACIAYEMLAGHAPFIFTNRQRERRWSRIATLSRRQWRTLEDALQPQRARRPSNIRDWVRALVADDAATFLPSHEYITSALPPRRRWLPAMGKFVAALLVVAIVSGGIYLLQIGAFKLPVRANSDVARSLIPPDTKSQLPLPAMASTTQVIESPPSKLSTDATTVNAARVDVKKTRPQIAKNFSSSPAAPIPTSMSNRVTNTLAAVAVTRATDATSVAPSSKLESSTQETPASSASPSNEGPARISFTTTRFTVASTESVARVNVVRHGSDTDPITIKWRTVPGSAKPDDDYAATEDGELVIPAGERYAAIIVPIVHGDAQLQASKWFDVELTDVSNAALSSTRTATVVIVGAD